VGPRAIIVLLVSMVALCLGTLIYVQHENSVIVTRDMETAVALSEIADRFDHEDGNLYRLMVDQAAHGHSTNDAGRVSRIRANLFLISAKLKVELSNLPADDQRRAYKVIKQIDEYNEAVGVVSSMLELDFASSVSMLRPFRENAFQVLRQVNGIASSGIADARYHADTAALHTRLLVGFVTIAVLVVALLSYLWLALASKRGTQLLEEIERRSNAEKDALQLARTDTLTGLMNRRAFNLELQTAIETAHLSASRLSIVLIDLDGFKEANDVHGHEAGDTVLKVASQRLSHVFGIDSTVARLGGDEFAVLIRTTEESSSVLSLSERASSLLRAPVMWRDNRIVVGASLGVSQYPSDGTVGSALLHAADVAMYQAKRNGKGGVCLFAFSMEEERQNRRLLESELRTGIQCGELQPFYQPLVRLADQRLCGFEVLARWQHPRLGLLMPDSFIKLAEATGQITDLTKAILRQACVDARRMPSHLRLAVNISPMQLEEAGLAESLIDVLVAGNLDPRRLEIEITEDAVMDDVVAAERVIAAFRGSGMSIALDDFGTGYSSLSNLRRLRFDKIKIDQSFVRTLPNSKESQKLVEAIIALALSFEMAVTAEGIEDADTAALLGAKGCTLGQGYFFGKPVSIDDLALLPQVMAA